MCSKYACTSLNPREASLALTSLPRTDPLENPSTINIVGGLFAWQSSETTKIMPLFPSPIDSAT
eukprot:4336290-Prorocentrum_lima.AAC.1